MNIYNTFKKFIRNPLGGNKYGRKIDLIIIHCTATSQKATVDSILNYFKNTLHWNSPGYHYIISPDGIINKTHPLDRVSNGAKGHNAHSVNIAYIGGKTKDNRTPAQKKAMKWLVTTLRSSSELGQVKVVGHRDLSPDLNNDGVITPNEWMKRCPSFDVTKWMKDEGI